MFNGILNYFRSAKAELEKVTWPSKQDTLRYSAVVVAASVVAAAFFATLDFGLNKTITGLLSRKQSAAGTIQTAPPSPLDVQPEVTASPVGIEAVGPNGQPATVDVNPVNTKK